MHTNCGLLISKFTSKLGSDLGTVTAWELPPQCRATRTQSITTRIWQDGHLAGPQAWLEEAKHRWTTTTSRYDLVVRTGWQRHHSTECYSDAVRHFEDIGDACLANTFRLGLRRQRRISGKQRYDLVVRTSDNLNRGHTGCTKLRLPPTLHSAYTVGNFHYSLINCN